MDIQTAGNRQRFDNKLVRIARDIGDGAFDQAVSLLAEPGRYNPIHTRLWSGTRHSYRESTVYALALLETGEVQRAEQILDVVVNAQDTDEESGTYGIWSYYHEEPLAEMVPPDWNWADFIGRELAFILLRHSAKLSAATRDAVRTALYHAARSIIRRNVVMSYTNIAAKGTFVTLAAGQLLDDPEIAEYAVARIERLCEQVRQAGSFAEYNSPGYWAITMEAIQAIRTYIDDRAAVEGATWLADRLWTHFVRRWHAPTGQLSGPMARAYSDDQGDNTGVLALLAKATGRTGPFTDIPLRTADITLTTAAVIDIEAPPAIIDRLTTGEAGLVRERFHYTPFGEPDRPHAVQGTTWRTANATLGTANTSEFWLQRRPLLGYWRRNDDRRWAQNRSVRMRFLKDDFDFSSAVFSSVQADGHVLWSVGFISPGGDQHIALDKIAAGTAFPARSLRLVIDFGGLDGTDIDVDGVHVDDVSNFEVGQAVRITTPTVEMTTTIDAAAFGGHVPRFTVVRDGDLARIEVALLTADSEQPVTLTDIAPAHVTGTFSMADQRPAGRMEGATVRVLGGTLMAGWRTSTGDELGLKAPATVSTATDHLRTFGSTVNGLPVDASGLPGTTR